MINWAIDLHLARNCPPNDSEGELLPFARDEMKKIKNLWKEFLTIYSLWSEEDNRDFEKALKFITMSQNSIE